MILSAIELREAHPDRRAHSTDFYYTAFADRLYKSIKKAGGDKIFSTIELTAICTRLTWYFEDIVADSGVWRTFTSLCHQMYGHQVPIFHEEKECFVDEPSLDAVKYIIWQALIEASDDIVMADSPLILSIANIAFDTINDTFEDAPINEQLKDSIDEVIAHACEDFDHLRAALRWICFNNHINISNHMAEYLVNSVKEMSEFENIPLSMKEYLFVTQAYFYNKVGPLALLPTEWLKAYLHERHMEKEVKELEEIILEKFDTYKYEAMTNEVLSLKSHSGRIIDVRRDDINLQDSTLKDGDGCISAFVFFQNEWHLNGIFIPIHCKKETDKNTSETEKLPEGTKNASGEELLKLTGGKEIIYFKNSTEMWEYMVKKMKYPEKKLLEMHKIKEEYTCIFIDRHDTETDNMFIGIGIEQVIADPDNPYYDKKKAAKEAIDILYDDYAATTPMVNYLIEHDFLPDIKEQHFIPMRNTPEQTRADLNFMMRTMRRDAY